MKAKKLLLILGLAFGLLANSACGLGEVITNNLQTVLPDPSLVADCLPTVEENIAVVPMGMKSTFITQKGVTDVLSLLKEEMNEEIVALKLSYQADGAYALFYLSQSKRFVLAKIAYRDGSIQTLFERAGECPTVLEVSSTHFIIKDNLKTGIELTFISRTDYSTKKVQILEEFSSISFLAMKGEYYLISTEQTNEENVIKKHHVFNLNSGIVASFENGDYKVKFSVGSNLQAIFYNNESLIMLKRNGESYSFNEEQGEFKQAVISAENLTLLEDYLIIGYPSDSNSTVYSLALGDYLNQEESNLVKQKATKKNKSELFLIDYDEYNQTLTFKELKSEKSVTIDIYNSPEGVVPTALKKIAVANEGVYGEGIFDIRAFENNSKLYFSCYYFDKHGNKIYCIFNFDFESAKINYIGVVSSPVNPLSLSPTDDAIMIVFFD